MQKVVSCCIGFLWDCPIDRDGHSARKRRRPDSDSESPSRLTGARGRAGPRGRGRPGRDSAKIGASATCRYPSQAASCPYYSMAAAGTLADLRNCNE